MNTMVGYIRVAQSGEQLALMVEDSNKSLVASTNGL